MTNPEEMVDGCLGLGEKSSDYRLTEGLLDALPTLYQQDEIIFQYNQGKQDRSKKSCTIFSPVGAVSDLWNIELDIGEIREWDEETYNKYRKRNSGWLVALGVDHIVECWNKSKHGKELGKVAYYSINLKDNELLQRIFSKRYTVCTGFNGNAKYQSDKNKDGVLNGTDWGDSTFGHAVNTIWGINTPARIKDNYFGTTKYNIYDVEHEFADIDCFFEKGYVITKVKEDKLEELKRLNEMNTVTLTLIENNSKMWHLTNDVKFREELHRQNNILRAKQLDIEEEIKKCM